MSRTRVKNLSGRAVRLQSVSGGVVCNLLPGGKLLGHKETYSIHTPTNTTYLEYWCVVGDSGTDGNTVNVILSSDDCAEFAEIELESTESGLMRWVGKKPRNGGRAEDPSALPSTEPEPSSPSSGAGSGAPSSGAASGAPSGAPSSPAASRFASKAENQGTRTIKGRCTIM